MKFVIARRSAPTWEECAELVRMRYARDYGADVHPNPDAFVVCYADDAVGDQTVSACAGVTFGSDRPFFSERYLDDAVENHVERLFGKRPERQGIVEIGPLASRQDGSGKEIIRLTPVIMWCLSMQYIMCTATQPLIAGLRALKIPFTPLQSASRDRLTAAEQDRWGNYYETQPIVGLIPLNGIASLFSDITSRYAFADPVVTLRDGTTERRAAVALQG